MADQDGTKAPENEVLNELRTELASMRAAAESAQAAAEAAEKRAAELERRNAEDLAKLTGSQDELRAQLKEQKEAIINQGRSKTMGGGACAAKTIGAQFIEALQCRSFTGDTGKIKVEIGTGRAELRSITTSTTYSDPQMVNPESADPKRMPVLADYLTVLPLSGTGGVEYIRETSDYLLETVLTAQADSGQADVAVKSIAGFSPGQVVTLSAGLAGEVLVTIDSIAQTSDDSPAGTITLTANLAANHASGVKIAHTTFAPTPEGKYKPGSNFTEALETASCYTVADGFTASSRALKSDNGRIEAKINQKLPRNVDLAEEDQLLNGTGANGEVTGILSDADVQSFAWSAGAIGDNKSDALARGANKVRDQNYEAGLVLMHHDDMLDIALTKDSEGRYLFSDTANGGVVNLPVVMCKALPAGKSVILDPMAATLYRAGEIEIRAFDQHKDYANKNMVYIRGERDISFTIEHPKGICVVSFDAAPS